MRFLVNNAYLCCKKFAKSMKIILAFDSFKGSLSAEEACHAAAEGLHTRYPDADIVEMPLSDGGEGLVACLARCLPLKHVSIQAHGPLMEEIEATYALSEDGTTAYMEMASTSGLTLVPEDKRNPLLTTTYGVGEMILDAQRRGCRHIVMGIGGSATCDGGEGMLQALEDQRLLFEAEEIRITVACDVNNPLYGPDGAAYVFAPQKGATTEQVIELDQRLRDFALRCEKAGLATHELAQHPGAGAAGGLGYGLMACLGATLHSGIDILLDTLQFDDQIREADFIITGEGHSDRQTLMGKVPHGVLRRAQRLHVPVHLLSGGIDNGEELLNAGFASVRSINEGDPRPLNVLMQPMVAKEKLQKITQ